VVVSAGIGDLDQLHAFVEERMATHHVPGVSVAVLDQGQIAWARGYGVMDVETGEPVTPETLFQAASISKPVAAMAALRLVEEGALDLDTPVNTYLKSWKLPDNGHTEENPVTLRHLLTHTGGLTVHGFPGYSPDGPVASTIQVLDGSGPANTDPIRVNRLPGSEWRYSGGGYTVMQQLLEDVTGETFPELMRRLVLDPAGMVSSSYEQPLPPERAALAAKAHNEEGRPFNDIWHIYPEMAAAGLWTTPTDLARLALAVQAAHRGDEGGILSQDMTVAQLTPTMDDQGLGFGVSGTGPEARFSHGGSNFGFKAYFLAFVEGGRGVMVMTNGDRGRRLRDEVREAVLQVYGWSSP
jgi:CubicO group peptidase (beta-lactamase class C family)